MSGNARARGGGATITVTEIDGSPSVPNVNTIKVSNGTLTNNGNGTVTVTTGGGGGGSISVTDGSTTVDPATSVDFTSGAVVTDLGGGVAGVAVSGGGGAVDSVNGQTGVVVLDAADVGADVSGAAAAAQAASDPVGSAAAAQAASQPLNANLTAVGGLTSAANKGIQYTGSGTAGTYDLTAAAKTVLDDATVAAMVDTLGGASSTGTGGLARATSPTFVTPILGTPTSGVATNLTGTASGLTAGTVTTNANLTGDVTSSGNATTIGAGKVTEAMQVLADNTTQNVSTSKHGYAPKAPNDATKFLDGTGAYSVPAGGGGGGGVLGAISYSSGSNGSWKNTSSGTVSDIDATNASVAVTIPASGNIVVMIQGEFYVSVAHSTCVVALRTGSTTLGRHILQILASGGIINTSGPPSVLASDTTNVPTWFYLTGLTPGALTIKAAFAVDAGGGTLNVAANDGASGHDNPFVMIVFAA